MPRDTLRGGLRRSVESGPEASWPKLGKLSIVQEQVESAVPAEAIVDYTDEKSVDLAVMGTHGRRGVNRMLFGSVT